VIGVVEDTDKGAHPLVNVASHRQRHFFIGELGLVYHVFQGLADVVLRIFFGKA